MMSVAHILPSEPCDTSMSLNRNLSEKTEVARGSAGLAVFPVFVAVTGDMSLNFRHIFHVRTKCLLSLVSQVAKTSHRMLALWLLTFIWLFLLDVTCL